MNFFPVLGSSFLVFRISFGIPVLKLGKINLAPLPAAWSIWKGRKVWIFTRNRSACNSLKWTSQCDFLLGRLQNDAGCLCQLSLTRRIFRTMWPGWMLCYWYKAQLWLCPAEENNPSVSLSVRTSFKLLGWPVWIAKLSCCKGSFVPREPLCWALRQEN